MYFMSDCLAFLFRNILRYRHRVISENLRNCFPDKSESEIKHLHTSFVSHLADIFLEGLKGFTMNDTELLQRYRVTNPECIQTSDSIDKSILFAGSHYNNWEWGVLIFNRALPIQVSGIYQIVQNKYIHQYLMHRRARWGMNLISVDNAIRTIADYPDRHAVMILSDQTPNNMKRAIWVDFLGRDTPCLHGLGVMAIKTGFPIYYYEVKKVKRGYYEITIEPLIPNPKEYTVEDITIRYTHRVEKTILQAPEYWLWSHNRWKRAHLKHLSESV